MQRQNLLIDLVQTTLLQLAICGMQWKLLFSGKMKLRPNLMIDQANDEDYDKWWMMIDDWWTMIDDW